MTAEREFVAITLVIGVPYALAVVVQDHLVPWVAHTSSGMLACAALGTLASLLAILCVIARRSIVRERRRAAELAGALGGCEQELRRLTAHLREDVDRPLRQIATTARWLERNPGLAARPADRRHLALLSSRAERIGTALDGLVPARARARRVGPRRCPEDGSPPPSTDRASARLLRTR